LSRLTKKLYIIKIKKKSKDSMGFLKVQWADRILPILASGVIKGIGKSIRLKTLGEEMIKGLDAKILYAFFHGRQFLLVWYMRKRNIALLSSTSRDGEIQARILKRFGYEIARGSSTRGGVSGIIGLKKRVESGYDIGLAVDGPTGPCYSVKDGVIFLAKKLGLYIAPLTSSSNPSWTFENAWDKYKMPYPFSKGIILFGKPYKPEGELQEEKERLSDVLISLTKMADEMVKNGNRGSY